MLKNVISKKEVHWVCIVDLDYR